MQESPLGCTDCIIGLYPNPGSNEAYLEFVSSTPDVTISIFDSSGKQVYSEINSGESGVKRKFVIDRKSMASGSYIIRITNENGIVMSAGLLKAR